MRQVFIEQVGAELERMLRVNFRKFYDEEVTKLKNLRITLVDYKKMKDGSLRMKPSGSFVNAMKEYLEDLADDVSFIQVPSEPKDRKRL